MEESERDEHDVGGPFLDLDILTVSDGRGRESVDSCRSLSRDLLVFQGGIRISG